MQKEFQLKWTVGKKMGSLVGGLLILFVVALLSMISKTRDIGKEIAEIADVDLPLIEVLTLIETHQLGQHLTMEQILRLDAGGGDVQSGERRRLVQSFEKYARLVDEEIKQGIQIVERAHGVSDRTQKEFNRVHNALERLEKQHHEFEDHAFQIIELNAKNTNGDRWHERIREVESKASGFNREVEALLIEIEEFTEESARIAKTHEAEAEKVSLIFGFVVVLLGVGVSFFFIRGLSRGIQDVSACAEKIASGNLRLEKLSVNSSDEIGHLAHVFNFMSGNLRSIVSQNREGTQNLNSSSSQILASTQQQATSTKEQAAAVHQTMATMEEVRQSGAEITERAKKVAQSAETTSAMTDTGLKSVEETVQTMEAIRAQVEEVAKNIVALSEKNQAVGEIIATVNDVSEQSKLLALNAAIEAAAAGEQGQSFSVVSNEMKNLAEQAKDATAQVRSILGDIQKGINTGVMQTEEAVKRVEAGKEKTHNAESTIRQMAKTTEDSIQTFQQIVAATNQQQIGFNQVTQALQDIRQATEQTTAGTGQLEKAMVNLNSLGQQLQKSVERYQV